MHQTDAETTAVWGIPILFEIKLRAYRCKAFCNGRHMNETCPNLSSLTAENRFLLFKGPRSIKKGIYCLSIDIILFNGWTIPLTIELM